MARCMGFRTEGHAGFADTQLAEIACVGLLSTVIVCRDAIETLATATIYGALLFCLHRRSARTANRAPAAMLPWRQRGSAAAHLAHRRLPPPRRTESCSPVTREAKRGLSYSRTAGSGVPRSPTPPASARTALPPSPPVEAKHSSGRRKQKLRRHSASPVRSTTLLRRMLRRQSTSPQPRKRDTLRGALRRRSASPIPGMSRRAHSPVSRPRRRSHSPLLRRLRRTRLTLLRAANAHPVTQIMRSHPLTRSYIEEAAPGITRETRANTERNAAAPPRGTRKPFKRKAPPKVVSRAELRCKKELMFADEGSLCGDGRREHVPIYFGGREQRPKRITAPPSVGGFRQ